MRSAVSPRLHLHSGCRHQPSRSQVRHSYSINVAPYNDTNTLRISSIDACRVNLTKSIERFTIFGIIAFDVLLLYCLFWTMMPGV